MAAVESDADDENHEDLFRRTTIDTYFSYKRISADAVCSGPSFAAAADSPDSGVGDLASSHLRQQLVDSFRSPLIVDPARGWYAGRCVLSQRVPDVLFHAA